MRSLAIIVTLSVLSVHGWAAEVYRTIDAQGNVIYSDRPGDERAVKVVIAATAATAPVTVVRQSRATEPVAAEPDDATIAAAERAQLTQDRAANCVTARQRSESYDTSHRLYRVAEDGERVYYNDAETAQARVDAQAAIARWCD